MESNAPPQDQTIPTPAPVTIMKPPLKDLLVWKSPARPFKPRDREFYTTAGSIIFLVCVILLFIKEFLLIMVLMALAFLVYILSTVKPEEVDHKITTRGIVTVQKAYPWEQLGRFWFETKFHDQVLMIENFVGLPTRLMLLIHEPDKKQIEALLKQYLIKEKPEKTQIEKAAEWLQKKVPLETSRPRTAAAHPPAKQA